MPPLLTVQELSRDGRFNQYCDVKAENLVGEKLNPQELQSLIPGRWKWTLDVKQDIPMRDSMASNYVRIMRVHMNDIRKA